MDVLTLRGVLTLDKSEYDRGLETAEQGARSFGGRFSKAAKIGVAAAAALGVAAGYAGKKIVDGAKQVAEYGDRVDKMSQKIGISAEAYQKWNYVMQLSDVNIDSMKMGMKTLSQQAEKNSDAFQKLGISQEEVKNLNQEQLFERTIKGLSDMEAGTERTALASQLLGRAGADMAPLLNQGSKAIEEQMEIAEKYGMVMPDATVKASAAFQDSLTTLQMTAQGLKNRLLGEFLPAMTKVTDGMAKMFTGDMSGLDDVIDGVKEFIGKIGEMAPKVLEAGGKLLGELIKGLVQKIPELLATGGQMLGKLLEGLQNSLSNAAPVIANIVTAIGQFITQNGPKLIQTGLTLIQALAQGLIQAIPSLIAAIPQLISSIINTFTSVDWVSVGAGLIKSIGSGIASAGGEAKEKVREIVDSIKQKVGQTFDSLKSYVSIVWNAIKQAITHPIETAREAVRRIIEKIKSFFPIKLGKLVSFFLPKISIGSIAKKIGEKLAHAPSFSVGGWTRYAKAMDTPYVLTKPTGIIAGEPGGEVVYGKQSLMNDIKKAVGGTSTNNYTFNVYATPNQSAREVAEEVRKIIIQEENRRRVAWA